MSIVRKTIRTKPKTKERTKELFTEFLAKKEMGVFNDSFMGYCYYIRKPKSSEKIHDYYYDDILNCNFEDVGSKQLFLEFMKDCLKKSEHEVALSQAIKKTPKSNQYGFESSVKSIIDTLTPYKNTLFEYVARPGLLENAWDMLDNIFVIIDDQEKRIAIFEAMIQTKTFNSLDTQKSIYNLAQKYLKQPQKMEDYFTKIKKVDETQSVVDYVQSMSVVLIGFNTNTLIGANLNTQISSDNLVSHIRSISTQLKDNYPNELQINNILMDYDSGNKQYTINVICKENTVELNKHIFESMLNEISRKSTYEEISQFKDNLDLFIKIENSKFMHGKLSETLIDNNSRVKTIKKI